MQQWRAKLRNIYGNIKVASDIIPAPNRVKFRMSRIQSEIIRDIKRQESMIQNEKNLSTETKPKLTQMLELAESGAETG